MGVLIELEPNESVDDGMKRINAKLIQSRLPRVRLGVPARTQPDVVPPNVSVAVSAPHSGQARSRFSVRAVNISPAHAVSLCDGP